MVQVSVRLYQSFILGPQFLRNSGDKGVRPADQTIMPRLIQTVRTLDIDSHHRLSWILLRLAFKAFFPIATLTEIRHIHICLPVVPHLLILFPYFLSEQFLGKLKHFLRYPFHELAALLL